MKVILKSNWPMKYCYLYESEPFFITKTIKYLVRLSKDTLAWFLRCFFIISVKNLSHNDEDHTFSYNNCSQHVFYYFGAIKNMFYSLFRLVLSYIHAIYLHSSSLFYQLPYMLLKPEENAADFVYKTCCIQTRIWHTYLLLYVLRYVPA